MNNMLRQKQKKLLYNGIEASASTIALCFLLAKTQMPPLF
jgi:hypothetical protein